MRAIGRCAIKVEVSFKLVTNSGFIQIMENLESHGILQINYPFPGLESHGV